MELTQVIKYPLLTEKTYRLMDKGIYTFIVDQKSNKWWVKEAIEFIFQVKVVSVNIIKVDKKPTKLGCFTGMTTGYKKAIIKLAEGNVINIFPEEAAKEDATVPIKEAKVVEKELVMSDAEKRAAEKISQKAKAAEIKKEDKPKDQEEVKKVGDHD